MHEAVLAHQHAAVLRWRTRLHAEPEHIAGARVGYWDLHQELAEDFKQRLATSGLGPCIVPAGDLPNVEDVGLRLRVNGVTRQDARTSQMIYDVPTIIEQLSRGLTLEAGDMIMTGTPSGTGHGMEPPTFLVDGDVVEAEIDGIGVLRNPVVAA